MPHLRFTRDKRGYENTYVVHATGRRGRARQRILYWFRSPPNVRVGRAALDEDAIRALEEQNPEIGFDWTRILEAQPPPAPVDPADRRRRGRRAPGAEPQPKRRRAPRAATARPRAAEAEVEPVVPTGVAPAVDGPPPVVERVSRGARATLAVTSAPGLPFGDDDEDANTTADAEVDTGSGDTEDDVSEQAPALVPVTVYHGGADVLVSEAPIETPRVPPVEATLGSEQLGRVRARYAEIMARITERAGDDPERLDELRRSADALNPDSWVTGAEITSGMQQFDERLGEIRKSLGIKRRRRSRRGGRRRRGRGTGGGDGTQGLDAAGQTTESPEASHQEEAGLDVDSAADEVDGDSGDDAS